MCVCPSGVLYGDETSNAKRKLLVVIYLIFVVVRLVNELFAIRTFESRATNGVTSWELIR